MPVYVWREKTNPKRRIEVLRPVEEYQKPPIHGEEYSGDVREWERVLLPFNVPFEHLRDRGVFDRVR